MGAEAITDLVYGITNPSGKLAVSIPWCVGQVPISYWDIKTGHVLTADNLENRFTSRYMDIPKIRRYIHLAMDCPIQSLIFRTLMCRQDRIKSTYTL